MQTKYALHDFPLYQLYLKMSRYDRQLGHQTLDIRTYFLLLEAIYVRIKKVSSEEDSDLPGSVATFQNALALTKIIQAEELIWTKEELRHICKVILFRPFHQEQRFNQYFEEYLVIEAERRRKRLAEKEAASNPQIQEPTAQAMDSPPKTSDGPDTESLSPPPATESSSPPPTTSAPEPEQIPEEEGEPVETVALRFEQISSGPQGTKIQTKLKEREAQALGKTFLLSGKYYPFRIRQLQQYIRTLRQLEYRGKQSLIDLEAAIEQIGKQGYLHSIPYRAKPRIKLRLTTLVDYEGSMIAFHPMIEDILKVAIYSEGEERTSVYYFRNCPINYVYRDRALSSRYPVERLGQEGHQAILVISDAGAARGNYTEKRVQATKQFLSRLKGHYIAWLNPIPRERWRFTSAQDISGYVNMFDASTKELSNLVKIFKGKIHPDRLLQ